MWDEEDERARAAWDAQREQELIDSRADLKGLAVGLAFMCVFVFLVFKIMQWYVSTMPPLRLH